MEIVAIILGVIATILLWKIYQWLARGAEEKFEFMTHNVSIPSNKDLSAHDYESNENKVLEHLKEYAELLINELGANGWELVMKWDDTYQWDNTYPRENGVSSRMSKLLWKRSSRNKKFGTGFGVNITDVSEKAKKRAEELHIDLSKLMKMGAEGEGDT
jgi:hypothetical protein